MRPADTTEAAHEAQIAAWRRLGAEGRLRVAVQMSEELRRISLEGERRRHPEYTEEQAKRAVARALLGEPLASRAWGPEPER